MSYNVEDIQTLNAGEAFRKKPGYSNYLIFEDGRIYSKKNKIFLIPIKKSTGYYAINLYDDNKKRKMFFIHRLVAELFIPNPNNYSEVNHLDEDKSNNSIGNLCWCSRIENENHGTKKVRELNTKTAKGAINGRIKIDQYTLEGKYLATWNSLTEAAIALNISIGAISKVINKKQEKAGGYLWKKAK